MTSLPERAAKFGLTGGITTAITYVSFITLLPFTNYFIAGSISWAASVIVGFILNRRITFGISGASGFRRHAILFVVGVVLQYALAMAGYAVLIGVLGLDPTFAFAANLVLTTSFSFAFHSLVTFRR